METTLLMLRPLEDRYHKLLLSVKSVEGSLADDDVTQANMDEKRTQYQRVQVGSDEHVGGL